MAPQLEKSCRKKFKLVSFPTQKGLRFLMTGCHGDWLSLHLLLKLRHCESKCRFSDGLCAVSDCTNMEHTLTPFHHTSICLTPAKFCDTPPPLKKHSREREVLIKAVTWESQVLSPVLLQFTQ